MATADRRRRMRGEFAGWESANKLWRVASKDRVDVRRYIDIRWRRVPRLATAASIEYRIFPHERVRALIRVGPDGAATHADLVDSVCHELGHFAIFLHHYVGAYPWGDEMVARLVAVVTVEFLRQAGLLE